MGNMEGRQERGIYLGFRRDTNEYIYGCSEGVRYSRSLQRIPTEDRWPIDALSSFTATPWSIRTIPDRRLQLPEGDQPAREVPKQDLVAVRRFRITIDDVKRFGPSVACPQCEWIQRYDTTRPGYQHVEACRERIIQALRETPDGQARLQQLEDRANRVISEYVERHAQPEAPQGEPLLPPPLPAGQSWQPLPAGDDVGVPSADQPDARDGDADQPMEADNHGGMDVDTMDPELLALVENFGCSGAAYAREHKQAWRRMVSEIFSPPRVTKTIKRMPSLKLLPGFGGRSV